MHVYEILKLILFSDTENITSNLKKNHFVTNFYYFLYMYCFCMALKLKNLPTLKYLPFFSSPKM